MPSYDSLSNTAAWFQKAVPHPNLKNLHTQLGCHFEEVAEMLNALYGNDNETSQLLIEAELIMVNLAKHLKGGTNLIRHHPDTVDRANLLDALCDQIVTAVGVGHMLKLCVSDGMNAVNASNWSKFVNGPRGLEPVFDENQKIQKGSGYFKADLTPFV